jgi:AraC-like DNA-binding protein
MGSSETVHTFWEIICVVEGDGELVSRGDRIPIARGTVCLVPPGVAHIEYSDGSVDLIWVGLRGSFLDRLGHRDIQRVRSPALVQVVESFWLFAERRAARMGGELDGMARRIVGFFERISRGGETGGSAGDVVDRAIAFMHGNASDPISISQVAAHVGCSDGHFYRVFRKRTGRTPIGYLTSIRMQRALHLLREGHLSVGEVARQVGYEDQFYFSRAFKKMMGMPPSVAAPIA